MAVATRVARDGTAYTHQEFVEFYGEGLGARMWTEADRAMVDSLAIVPLVVDTAPAGEGFSLDGAAFMIGPASYGYEYMTTTATWHGAAAIPSPACSS